MAEGGPSEHFCYADEEVFIGKKRTQREIIKSTLMGQNYDSPVAKPSSTSNLPDVINLSSDKKSLEPNSGEVEPEVHGLANLSIDALIEASKILDERCTNPIVEDTKLIGLVEKPAFNSSTFTNLDCSLLTGVSESVLDISHGSSLPSPAVERNDSSLGLLTTAVYEDISCDDTFDTSEKQTNDEVDLHMSVDEADHMMHGFDVTRPTLYKSCLSEFSNSVYTTANNTEDLSSFKQPSSTFSDYRNTFEDSVLAEGMDNSNGMDVDSADKNETSFEIVMNNRQNSFAASVAAATKTESTSKKTKPVLNSKLPVYNCQSSILKPSTLQANLDSKLTARNYKWAKTLPKPSQAEPKNTTIQVKTDKTLVKTSTVKNSEQQKQEKKPPAKILSIQKPKLTKTPVKYDSGQSLSTDTKTLCKTPVNKLIPKRPSFNQSPVQRTPRQPSKILNSNTKTPKEIRPVSSLLSSGKRNDNKHLPEKDLYKNVISPVRAYIKNAPIQLLRKVHVPEEQIILMGSSAKTVQSNIPKLSTPLPGSSSKTSSTSIPVRSSKAAQRLVYNKHTQDQENMDPNYTRDTLPPRMLKAAAAVFMKEPEPPKRHLPKMGETMQKLVDTPRPKVIVHQGRVMESPKSKGKLIPTINVIPSTPETSDHQAAADSRISVRVIKSADCSN